MLSIGYVGEEIVKLLLCGTTGTNYVYNCNTTVSASSKELFLLYGARWEVEGLFDFLKNLLEQDRLYMQGEYGLEGWVFVNHVSLLLYPVYNLLREEDLLGRFYVADF